MVSLSRPLSISLAPPMMFFVVLWLVNEIIIFYQKCHFINKSNLSLFSERYTDVLISMFKKILRVISNGLVHVWTVTKRIDY